MKLELHFPDLNQNNKKSDNRNRYPLSDVLTIGWISQKADPETDILVDLL